MKVWVVRCTDSDLTSTPPVLFQSEESARKFLDDELHRLWKRDCERFGRVNAGTLKEFRDDWKLNYTCTEQEVLP